MEHDALDRLNKVKCNILDRFSYFVYLKSWKSALVKENEVKKKVWICMMYIYMAPNFEE